MTQQGSLSLPLSGEQQPEQPTGGDADEVTVTYEGEAVYTEQGALAVRYTIEVTNGNEPQEPSGGDEGEEQPEGSDGAVKVKIVQDLMSDGDWFSSIKTQEPADKPAGAWNSDEKTLTWEDVTIAAGETWSKTVTVLIDSTKISSIADLSKDLSSTVSVYEVGGEADEGTPLDEATETVNLKELVESEGIQVVERKNQEQTVYWLDNNASGNRPEPEVYAGKVGLQFYIGNQENPDEGEWITLDENNMAQLGLTKMPDILCPEDNTQSQWMLSAELPTEVGYKGTGITQQVKWRMTPPAEDAEIPAGPEKGGIRPNLSEVYYLDKVEGEGSETWYYLYRDEVSFNIDLRDAVNAGKIIEDQLKGLLTENFKLSYDAGDGEQSLNWDDITVDIKENGDGQYTLTLVNAVAYSRNGKGVHYYLKPMGSEDQEKKIPLNQNWPGNGEGGDYYDVECDNTGLDNVGNITDKVANGGTLVLTRQGEIAYHATKVWIDPEGNTDGRPEGHFELWRYTYSEDGGSFKEATTVTGVENVSFKDIKNGEITFTNSNPTNPQNENLFPKYDKDGNRYVYIMKEVIDKEGELSYEQVFGKVGEDGNVIKDSDKAPPIGGNRWVRDSQDNFVYNNGTITNRINEKETVSVTKKWDASSFQASLEDVEVEVTLYGRPENSDDPWEPVKGQDGEDLVYTMGGFSAANDTMSQTVTVNTYNSEGQEMQYRFFETAIVQGDKRTEIKLTDEELKPGANLPDKSFTLELDGNAIDFVSKRASDTSIGEQGQHIIENVIQDEITYTINKEWIAPTEPHPVRFAIYQQGPNAENKLVGIVTLDDEIDGENQYSSWEKPAGSEEGKNPTLTVGEGEKPYEVTYQVKDEFAQLVIEGLPRYDEHGYTYEYIALELDGSPEQTTQIDADGNYITDVVNGPGRGYRIMLRKRWIDNSDIEHREPVTLQVYYQVDEISDLENDFLLATVILGEEGEPWYELVGFSEVDLKEKLGEDFSTGNDFYKHLYIREISIGNSGADDRTTQEEIFIGEDGAVENKCVDQIEATNHTYEATYETQLDGLTVEEGEDTPGISDPLFIVTNRRLGNVDLTVTKEWQDGGQLQELLKYSNVVPVVKLVFDEEKNNAEPPEGVTSINYDTGTVQIGNEEVQIKDDKEGNAEAIQLLPLEDEPTLYFYNLPKYDNQGRVARYKVVELWTTKGNIESGKVDNVDECYDLKNFLEKNRDTLSDDLKSLLNDLSVSYQEDSYKENDGQKESDKQQITITNKLTGTKEIKFYKEWNDQYALEHGKRPDLYLTLYQTTKGSGKMQLYADHSWDKQALTISEDGGENAAQAEKETDENYWICTFPDLPKYDANGDEYIYYAVERLTVNDPSDFDYAPAQFEHDGAQADLTVEYDEDGKVVKLPSDEMDADGHKILMLIGDDVALLEGGTFVNTLEDTVTISGRKLWNSVPLTADSADLPTVTFEVYQYLESEVPEDSEPAGNDKPVRSMTIESNQWDDLKTDDNQYVFTFDGMEGEDGKPVPFPLYNDKGERYVYILHEVTDKVSDTDWDLVYQDPVYNEYQITNTYDPQLGALSVKKLLEIPTVDSQQYYPAVTMDLYRALPDEEEKYSLENAELLLDERQVWTSEEVKEAVSQAPTHPIEPPQPIVVEKIFTFKDLPKYAPNGQEYKYFVVEVLEDTLYYDAAVVQRDESDIEKVFNDGSATQPTDDGLPTGAIELTSTTKFDEEKNQQDPIEPEGGIPVKATFSDRYPEDETITLKVTKEWIDNNDALKLRPDEKKFIESLKVYRKADGQGGTGGAGAIPEEEITEKVTITPDEVSQDDNHYTYTIKGKDVEGLEKIAPNGMPWIYIVRENLSGTSYVVKQGTTTELSESATSAGEDNILDLGVLSNTLTTSQSFQKQWQNHDGGSITEDYLGLGDITITGQLWVGVKDGDMKPASEFFKNGWDKWFDDVYWTTGDGQKIKTNNFQIDLMIQLGNNDQTETISNLPRVAVENGDTKELVYAIVETGIKVTNPDYTQTFTWEWENEKLTVTSQDPLNGLFTPQEITVGGSTTIINNRLQTTNLSVEKLWVGDENETNLRPLSVDVVVQRKVRQEGGNQSEQADELTRATLMAPRTTEDGWEFVPNGDDKYLTETLEEATGWKASIPNLPSYGVQDGALVTYEYRIHELKPGWKDDGNLSDDEILDADEKYNGHYTVSAYSEDGLTVTNTLTHMDITAVKAWKPEGLHGDYAEVTFELQSRVEGIEDWSMVNIEEQENPVTLDGTPDGDGAGAGEFEAWKARWTELPRTDSNGSTIEYRVKETLASDLIENEHVTILYPEKGITGSTADKTYTVTNIPLGQLTVTKKNGDGNGLAGVEFTLTGGSDGARKVTTDASGEAIFDKLPLYDKQGNAITYTLTESSTPDDYIQLDEEINVSFTTTDRPEDGIYWETTDGKYLLHEVEYEVVNGQYFPVVHTGGSGFYWPGVLGAGAAAAGVLYLIRRKTKGHNTER